MLQKIVINNFKSIKHLDYNCAGLNLLTGMNGAGKSSFIQMLRLMSKVADRRVDLSITLPAQELGAGLTSGDFRYCYSNNPFEVGFSVDFTPDTDCLKSCTLQRVVLDGFMSDVKNGIEIQHPDFESLNQECYREYTQLRMDDIDGHNVSDEELNHAYARGDDDFALALKKMRDAEKESATAFCKLWRGMRFVDAFRIKPTAVHAGGSYSAAAGLFGGEDDLAEESFNAEGQDVAEYICKSKGCNDQNALLDRINACLNWVSPGARLSIREQDVGGQEFYIESVGFGEDAVDRQYKPQNVGFGISYILPVLVTLLSARPGSILIVENPEAHLHPRGQAEMGKLIAETVARGVQIFVETHSDHLINGVRVAVKKGVVKPDDVNIAFFERGPHDALQNDGTKKREIYSEVTNIKVDANGALSEWPKDFMDEWGNQQMKLLRP